MSNTATPATAGQNSTALPAVQIDLTSRAMHWAGYALSGIVVLFMLMDCTLKILQLPQVLEATAQLGYANAALPPRALGWLFLLFTVLYAYPRTAVLGAILLTAVMGGAVATHVRVSSPLFTHILFGIYLGVFVWGGLFLRDARLRALLPWRR